MYFSLHENMMCGIKVPCLSEVATVTKGGSLLRVNLELLAQVQDEIMNSRTLYLEFLLDCRVRINTLPMVNVYFTLLGSGIW